MLSSGRILDLHSNLFFMRFHYLLLLTSIAFIAVHCSSKKDDAACKSVHMGTFYYYPQMADINYEIIRDSIFQREITLDTKDTAIFKMDWMDDCTYSLDYVSGGPKYLKNETRKTVFIQLLKIEKEYYTMKACVGSLNAPNCFTDTLWSKPK